jgi:hypothetical protein
MTSLDLGEPLQRPAALDFGEEMSCIKLPKSDTIRAHGARAFICSPRRRSSRD